MDLSNIRTEVRDILGEDAADFWTDAELNRYITEAQFRFLGEARWPWMITSGTAAVAAATATVALGEGIEWNNLIAVSLQKATDTRIYLPKRVSPSKGFDLRTMYSTTHKASYPEWYYISAVADADADNLYIYTLTLIPTPTSAMTLAFLYVRDGVVLTGDTVKPDLPVEYHKALVHYAAGTAWLKEVGPDARKAREQFEMYASVVGQAKNDHMGEPDDTPLVMGKDEPQWGQGRYKGDPWLLRIPETLGP